MTNATDEYGHPAGGTIAISAISGGGAAPDGTPASLANIRLRDGSGQASQTLFKAENGVVLQGNSSVQTAQTTPFNVSHGAVNSLAISGEPLSVTAGVPFTGNISVNSYDAHGNPASSYTGAVSFDNNDPRKVAAEDLPPSTALGAGQALFPGSAFKLRTTGARRIWVSDGTRRDTTGVINVLSGAIADYAVTVPAAVTAGQPATITITGAVDAGGNPASGTVLLDFADGNANHAIGGNTPIFTTIAVSNGAGSGSATFFKSEGPVTIRANSGGVLKTSNGFTVSPGTLGGIRFLADPADLSPLPASLTAGSALGSAGQSLLVVVYDSFGNIKTDYNGTLTFSSSDVLAVLPGSYNFQISDAGEKRFARSLFTLRSSGNQTITSQSGGYSQKLDPVQVKSDLIQSFAISAGATQTAGIPFSLIVTNARDQFNNLADGLVQVRAFSGGGTAPGGQPATFTPIPVSGGSGEAAQTLVKTETARLIGEVKSGSTVIAAASTGDITVRPGALGSLALSGLPTSVAAEVAFSGTVVVKAYDGYLNPKSDYIGTVRFTSSAASAQLPANFTFTNSSEASWSGSQFKINTPGPQTITVTDINAAVAATSGSIDVRALIIKSITSTYATVNRGQANIPVTMEVWNYGTQAVSNMVATLNFSPDRNNEYTGRGPISANPVPPYASGVPGKLQITFPINVGTLATLGAVTLDGSVSGTYNGNAVVVTGAVAGGTLAWNVQEQASMQISEISASQPAVTRGQTAPWSVTVGVYNSGSYPVNINFAASKTYLQFRQAGTSFTDNFIIAQPAAFTDGTVALGSKQTKRINFVISGVSAPPGTYSIVSWVETTDGLKASDAFGSILVQTPEDLVIDLITPSQAAVTANDATWPWYVDVPVTNQGGSTVEIDSMLSTLTFSGASGFTVGRPRLVQNGYLLAGGASDLLRFRISKAGTPAGVVSIQATVAYNVVNSGASGSKTTPAGSRGSVTLQNLASGTISSSRAVPQILTRGKSAPWRIVLTLNNPAGANNGNLELDLDNTANSYLRFYQLAGDGILREYLPTYNPALPANLAGSGGRLLKPGIPDSLVFTGVVPVDTTGEFFLEARISGRDVNSRRSVVLSVSGADAAIEVQTPANIVAMANSIQPAYLTGGTFYRFQLNVMNIGLSTLVLDPDRTLLSFSDGTNIYSALLDDGLGTEIPGSSTRTLYFHANALLPAFRPGRYQPILTLAGTENGNSYGPLQISLTQNSVTVADPREVMITAIRSSAATVTAGQSKPWYVDLEVINNGGSTLHLDSARIALFRGSADVTARFALIKPDIFLTGSPYLRGNTATALRYRIDAVDAALEPGQITIGGRIWLTDSTQAFRRIDEQSDQGNSGVVVVQSPAELSLLSFAPSQRTVTLGQSTPWTITAVLRNQGGSALALDTLQSRLNFSAGDAHFIVDPPRFFSGSGDSLLSPESQDSLSWRVTRIGTDRALLGAVRVNGLFALNEVNSGRPLQIATAAGLAGFDVTIQDSALARLSGFRLMVPQDSLVNGGQKFYIQARVSSPGAGDGLAGARVRFHEHGFVKFIGSPEVVVGPVPSGGSLWTEPGVQVEADTTAGLIPLLSAQITAATAANTGEAARILPAGSERDSSRTFTIQRPGLLAITRVLTSRDTIPAGYNLDWTITVDLVNRGQGTLVLDPPKAGDILIKQGFVVRPPVLGIEARTIPGGGTARVIYEVIASSSGNGQLPITARLTATDLNDTARSVTPATAQTTIYVSTSARTRIVRTFVDPANFRVDAAGVTHVNTRQNLSVEVEVENNGGQPLKRVVCALTGPRSRIITAAQTIENLGAFAGAVRLSFQVVADSLENLAGETLTAVITGAVGEDDSQAFIAPAADDGAEIRIYKPALLRLRGTAALTPTTERMVSYGQTFPVEVVVENLGSEPAGDIGVRLSADPEGRLGFAANHLAIAKSIAGGDTGRVLFYATAGGQSGQVLISSVISGSNGLNSRQPAAIQRAGQDSSTLVGIERGAELRILAVRAQSVINAGDAQNYWPLHVTVENGGEADMRFAAPSPADIEFFVNGVKDDGYRINAPAKLLAGDSLVLKGQSRDSLLYIITRNGDIAGTAEVRVTLTASDLNKVSGPENLVRTSGATSVEVSSTSWVRVNTTSVVPAPGSAAIHRDQLGIPLINRGRQFMVEVEAETSELTGIDSIRIELTAQGSSYVVQPVLKIPRIGKGSKGSVPFTVVADDSWDPAAGEVSETFSARILSALAENTTLPAQIREPDREIDAQVLVRIQNPARLAMQLSRPAGQDSILTAGQEFRLVVTLRNSGSASLSGGQYRIVLPAGKNYRLLSGSIERDFAIPLGVAVVTDTLLFAAPGNDSFSDTLRVELSGNPVDDNTGQFAAIQAAPASAIFTTLKSGLALQFAIYSPTGAGDRILSTAQQMVLRAIVQATDNLTEKSVKLTAPVAPSYVLLSPAEQEVTASRDTIYWQIQVPGEERVTAHQFLATARGRTADGWQEKQATVTIDQIVARATLWIDNLEVSSPSSGVMESGKAIFSVRQQATLRTRVRNLGTARVAANGRVTLSLQKSGLRLVGSDSVKTFTAGAYVTWNVQAADTAILESRDIRAEISLAPNDENTNAPATITNSSASLDIVTEARGVVRIDNFYINSPAGALDNTISADQSFEVTAEITSTNVRDLLATISYTGAFSTNTPSVVVNSGSRQVVRWTMRAPHDTGNNILSLTVSGSDLRSGLALTNQSRTINVTTQAATRFTLTPRIILPAGLNNKISSESAFRLALRIEHKAGTADKAAAEPATIRLNVPAAFLDGSEPLVKSGFDSLVWNLTAPAVRQDTLFDVSFEVNALPADANSGLEAGTDFRSVYFPLWVVRKARVAIRAEANGQSNGTPVPVRVGNEFALTSILTNLGSADLFGTYSVRLRLPAGYTTAAPLQVTTDKDSVTWRIKAPERVGAAPDTVWVRLLSAPNDIFTKTAAEIAIDSVRVLMMPETGFVVARTFGVMSGSVGLRGGTGVPMLGLSLQNKDLSVGSRSLLDTLTISFRNRRGEALPANAVVSRILAVRHDDPARVLAERTAPGNASQVTLDFVSVDQDTISGSEIFGIDILVDIAAAARLSDFVVAVDSASAIVARDAFYRSRLSIADSSLDRADYLGFSSGTLVVMQADVKESFCNYPNPFGAPSRPLTKFVYYLSQPSDVQIKIFTLTGDLVQAWEFTKSAHPGQTSAGIHQDQVVWDGRNGRGEKVMNGIYLAYLRTEYGELAVTKIAVVK